MIRPFHLLASACFLASVPLAAQRRAAPAPAPAAHPVDTLVYRGLKFRAVGPSTMGGRMSAFAVREGSPQVIFAAAGTGGLFKTTNNGTTWSAVFEDQPVASIGAVAVSQRDSNLVWVGTGEGNGRNSSSWGNGVYRSSDGGGKWTHLGLENTHDIPALVIDPRTDSTVWVAALGHLWGKNPERGVFKTTDGGKTWTKLGTGLPPQTGRIGLDIYRKNPQIVYAVIESDVGGPKDIDDVHSRSGGVFRSDDGGAHWRRLSDLAPRGFYFTKVRVDPTNDAHVYVLGYGLDVSDDSGHTFRHDGAEKIHGDLHALWIDPHNPDHLILGTDGGIYFSWDRSKTWDFLNNVATGEFYEMAYDYRTPYRICGGLQDNGTWCGPSRKRSDDGIAASDWYRVGDCDGYYVQVDSTDPDIVYAECQQGYAFRLNQSSGAIKSIRPSAKEGTPAFRFNWNTPFAISHFDPTVLYFGGNQLFRLTARGDAWEVISPDLSTMNPQTMTAAGSGAETYNTIVTLAESPLDPKVLWAGTDDGNIQLTRDGGATWTNVGANLRGLPKPNLYVARIEASHVDSGTAYVAIDGHRSDVFQPLAFMTTDFGRTWTSIAANLPAGGPVKALREDPRNRNLLFAGTEFGLYFSLDRGASWNRFRNGLPTVAFDDIAIHPRERDLIVGTHGRSIYVLDQIIPLEELTPALLDSAAHLFSTRPVQPFWKLQESGLWGHRPYQAANPPFGAAIDYYLKSYALDDVSITIADSTGREVAKLTGSKDPGLNRVIWDLQPKESLRTGSPGDPTEYVAPGTYTVTLSAAGKTLKTTLQVVAPER